MVAKETGFRPHECRVLRENKITAEHPKGKSKGFGFVSFSTHREALVALRKLNNNPNIFGKQHVRIFMCKMNIKCSINCFGYHFIYLLL